MALALLNKTDPEKELSGVRNVLRGREGYEMGKGVGRKLCY